MPDPSGWPEEIRTWFRSATGGCQALDIFIFNYGRLACLYLQDAVTAAAVLEIDASEWHTERGYPVFVFDAARIDEIQRQLSICGYDVHVLEPSDKPKRPGGHKRAKVLSISVGRERAKRERAR